MIIATYATPRVQAASVMHRSVSASRPRYVDDGSDEYAAAHAYASTVKEFQDVMARRAQAQDAWRDYFRDLDAFLVPVAFVPAFPHDHGMPLKSRVLQTPEGAEEVPGVAFLDMLRYFMRVARHCGPSWSNEKWFTRWGSDNWPLHGGCYDDRFSGED